MIVYFEKFLSLSIIPLRVFFFPTQCSQQNCRHLSVDFPGASAHWSDCRKLLTILRTLDNLFASKGPHCLAWPRPCSDPSNRTGRLTSRTNDSAPYHVLRGPSNVVLKRDAATMRLHVRQGDTSHSIDDRDNDLQKVTRLFRSISCAILRRSLSSDSILS